MRKSYRNGGIGVPRVASDGNVHELKAFLGYTAAMVLTLEKVPGQVATALERQAAAEGKSVSEVALEAMARGLGFDAAELRDLSDVAGTMTPEDAKAIEDAVAWMDQNDLAAKQ